MSTLWLTGNDLDFAPLALRPDGLAVVPGGGLGDTIVDESGNTLVDESGNSIIE